MKVNFSSIDDAISHVREKMLATMRDNIASMRRDGCCEQSIQAMIEDTEQKIVEMHDEIMSMYGIAQEEFDAPRTLN